MTTLVVEDLITTLDQVITLEKRVNLERIRLCLLKEVAVVGRLVLTVKGDAIVIDTVTINISDITIANAFHGMVSFVFTTPLTVNSGEITLTLSSSGYTSGISWVSEYINRTNNTEVDAETDFQWPLSTQLWEFSEKGLING